LRKAKTDGVTPAKAGVQGEKKLDSRFRGNDKYCFGNSNYLFLALFFNFAVFGFFLCVYCWRNNSALFYIVRVVTSRNEYQISELDKDVELGIGK